MELKKIRDLLNGVGVIELKGDKEALVAHLTLDSRQVQKNSLFAAVTGSSVDGHDYIDKAVDLGASVVLCQIFPDVFHEKVTYVRVENSRKAIGSIADEYYNSPSEKICCVGVTGTNGKTSIATMLYNLFKDIGYRVGLISTIEILVNEKKWKASLTTPDVISVHGLMNDMVEANCTHVFMEVSSHAADQMRVANVQFDIGVFSNLTRDHLDYHGSFRAYLEAKQSFFTGLSSNSYAIINIDDKHGEIMIEKSRAQVKRYSARRLTDYKVRVLSQGVEGMMLDLNSASFITQLTGDYNAMNLTAVYAVADLIADVDNDLLIERLSAVKGARGRLEIVHHRPRVIVDYAHTPDAVSNLLSSINMPHTQGKIISLIGCGGDRDKGKRPVMAQEAYNNSDMVILTSDNPRSEDPQAIIDDMKKGLEGLRKDKVLEIIDRASAIKTALALANENDTVVIMGKGHEEYQEINGERHFFSDQQIVKDILSNDI